MSYPKYDFHIHTLYSGCGQADMSVQAIVNECTRNGLQAIGITDHFDSKNPIDIHKKIRRDILQLESTDLDVYFGVELDFIEADNLMLTQELCDEYQFQYVIAGVHDQHGDEQNLNKLAAIQHRNHLKICQNPMVDILAHPYGLNCYRLRQQGWPPIDSMKMVPRSYRQELGQAARETHTAIEINGYSVLVTMGEDFAKAYVDYLGVIAAENPMFSFGSDAHAVGQLCHIEASWKAYATLGLTVKNIYTPTAF